MEEQPLNFIEGTISSIIFQNEENGYTILRLETGDGEVTVVGCMPGTAPGESLTVRGGWVHHASYGEQFKAQQIERRMPRGVREVYHYLASGVVKGVGETTARRMVEQFGEDTLDILEQEPEKLTCIKGITLKRAKALSQSFAQQMGMRRLLEFLTHHGFSAQLGTALYRQWGAAALTMIRENPYLLVREDWGVGFAEADALGETLGVGVEDPKRLECALLFELIHNLDNGHVFLPRAKLLQATAQLSMVEREKIEVSLDVLLERGELVQEQVAGQIAVYLAQFYEAETYVAQRLSEMSMWTPTPPEELQRLIQRIQRQQGITYASEQKRAIELAAGSRVMLLTGGPGTGKTTTVRGILTLFETMGLDTAMAAPTGRAAQRLGKLCDAEATTIHRLLEIGLDRYSGQLVFNKNADNPLPADAVIIDEASMVDISLMAALLSALRPDCRLILVGDPDQLPSVGPGCVFADLIHSKAIPTVYLTEIFRQAAQSAIVRNAHMVNMGQVPELRANDNDFFFLHRADSVSAVQTVVDLCYRRLPERMGIPIDQIQVLSPTRRQGAGTASLNRMLQQVLNPPSELKEERRVGEYIFRHGDRVMQTKNNYDILWRSADGTQSGMGMFNGDIGRIVAVAPRGEVITVDFDGKLAEYTPEMLIELEPAYAITVHKSQGSEYRAVILLAVEGAPRLLTRDVLYTAMTRAKSLFILVGDEQVVRDMVANDRKTRRYCGLRARLAAWVQE